MSRQVRLGRGLIGLISLGRGAKPVCPGQRPHGQGPGPVLGRFQTPRAQEGCLLTFTLLGPTRRVGSIRPARVAEVRMHESLHLRTTVTGPKQVSKQVSQSPPCAMHGK